MSQQKVFFTSDLHFGHENVIKFDERPFASVEEMDAELIRRWNAKVGKGDLVYVLGDMIWKTRTADAETLIKSLNGQIILIKGNHDRFLHSAANKNALAGVKDYDDISVTLEDGTKRRVILFHHYIPFYIGYRHGAIHLYGHSHTTDECFQEELIKRRLKSNGFETRSYNVGCMHWNYEPVTLDEILAYTDMIEKAEAEAKNKAIMQAIEDSSRVKPHRIEERRKPARTWEEYKATISKIDPEFRQMLEEIQVMISPNPDYEPRELSIRESLRCHFALGVYANIPHLRFLGLTQGQILKHQRFRQKLTPEEVATKAGIPLEEYVSYESGAADISEAKGKTLIAIARVLNTDPEALIEDNIP